MDSDTKTDVYTQFVQGHVHNTRDMKKHVRNTRNMKKQAHVRNTRDMKKLLDALRSHMPEQKYPPQSDDSKRRVLKLIDVFLDVISGEKTREILLDLFNGLLPLDDMYT